MGFWDSRTGAPITGDESSSFAGNFRHLPDNTVATAIIKSFLPTEYQGDKSYQIIWQLIDGDFKGSQAKQRLEVYHADDAKAQRSLNMFMRICKLCDYKLEHSMAPQPEDLAPMKGKILCIKIGNGFIQGEERTWVREVHAEGALETSTGSTPIVTGTPDKKTQTPESALQRNSAGKKTSEDELNDIPF